MMLSAHRKITIRRAESRDLNTLCFIINEIIAAGGTTAFEVEMTPDYFGEHFVQGPDCITCFVAETVSLELLGFQVLAKHPALPSNWADIGTFVRIGSGRSGIGTELFTKTKQAAQDLRILAINATIRADNPSGIPYYDRMGFATYNVDKELPLRDGRPVDRISKCYML